MEKMVRYFLGANTGAGFASLYDSFINEGAVQHLNILKGGPGCGKSSFMRAIASALEDEGHEVEYILCSGDPDSLDGIFIPALETMYVDGTAPHVVEPRCAGVFGSYVNLGVFYDTNTLEEKREDILALNATYKSHYTRCYALMAAAASFETGLYDRLFDGAALAAIRRRAEGVVSRELRRTKRPRGRLYRRLFSAFTCDGAITLSDSFERLCDRLYILDNDYCVAPVFLDVIAEAALSRGYDILFCPSATDLHTPAQILIPELRLGFVTDSRQFPCGCPGRHIRLDTHADAALLRRNRAQYRADAALRRSIYARAYTELTTAKALHDELERLYNPHVDFGSLYALAQAHASSLLHQAETRVPAI